MQDIIIKEILKHSLIPFNAGKRLIVALFENDSSIPEEIKNKRPSLLNFNQVVKWGGSVENAYIAALSSLNSAHGCFGDAYNLIESYFRDETKEKINFIRFLSNILSSNKKIPGFGNPVFKKTNLDKRCLNIEKEIYTCIPKIKNDISFLINTVRSVTGKKINTNLVFWNALVVYILGLPKNHASLVFILASFIKYTNLLTQEKKENK